MAELKVNIESEVLYLEVNAVIGVKINSKPQHDTQKVHVGNFRTIKALEDFLTESEDKNASL